MKNEGPILDHDGLGQQHHEKQGILSSRRDPSPELKPEQQQGKPGVPSKRRDPSTELKTEQQQGEPDVPSSRRDPSPELKTEQQQEEPGVPSSRRDSSPELKTEQREPGVPSRRRNSSPEPTNKISLAFSNYAHVEMSRTGIGRNRRYEFEYWGTNYIWVRKRGDSQSGTAPSYSLCKSYSRDIILAHIKVQETDEYDIRAGHSAGGWIPRALMRITDDEIISPRTGTNDLPE